MNRNIIGRETALGNRIPIIAASQLAVGFRSIKSDARTARQFGVTARIVSDHVVVEGADGKELGGFGRAQGGQSKGDRCGRDAEIHG